MVPEFGHDASLLEVDLIEVVVNGMQACNDSAGVVKLTLLLLVIGNLVHVIFASLGDVFSFFQSFHVHDHADDGLW